MIDYKANEEKILKRKAREIACKVYPHDWLERDLKGAVFKVDRNAGRRAVAQDVAKFFLRIISSDETAKRMTKAFVRRYAGSDAVDNLDMDYCHMLTAMMVCELSMQDCDKLDELNKGKMEDE